MNLYRFEFAAMASRNELQLWGGDEATVRAAAAAAIADVRRIEAKYSRFRDDSVVGEINRCAGRAPVAIDSETAALLDYAELCHQASGGRFDVTSGVLRRVWDFRAEPPVLPDAGSIEALLPLVDWHLVERGEASVRLRREGMELDLGGIGKEYAADRAATSCIEAGVAHGLVNLGGDVRIIGAPPDGAPWRVAIQDPRGEGAIATVALREGAIATSGDYQRYVEIDGVRYCHLLDARTGWPVSHWRSISVIAPLCVAAGTCATVAMLRAEGAEAFLREHGVAYVAIDRHGTRHDNVAAQL